MKSNRSEKERPEKEVLEDIERLESKVIEAKRNKTQKIKNKNMINEEQNENSQSNQKSKNIKNQNSKNNEFNADFDSNFFTPINNKVIEANNFKSNDDAIKSLSRNDDLFENVMAKVEKKGKKEKKLTSKKSSLNKILESNESNNDNIIYTENFDDLTNQTKVTNKDEAVTEKPKIQIPKIQIPKLEISGINQKYKSSCFKKIEFDDVLFSTQPNNEVRPKDENDEYNNFYNINNKNKVGNNDFNNYDNDANVDEKEPIFTKLSQSNNIYLYIYN